MPQDLVMNNRTLNNNRAQEEIVGFVLIVIIIAIFFLILLGVYIRRESPEELTKSSDVSQFLDALSEYTTSCSPYEGRYYSIAELVDKCTKAALCSSGKTACMILEDTITTVMETSWQYGPDRPTKGYVVLINQEMENLVEIRKGVCGSSRVGADKPLPNQIAMRVEICYTP